MMGLVPLEEEEETRTLFLHYEDTARGGHLQIRHQTCQHLYLRLLSPGTARNERLLFEPPHLWYFVIAA